MGSTWDGETDGKGVAFDPKTWAALSEHLLPGAFIFVFGSSRGWHRLAVAIEDAGFVFHPSLMVWGALQGQGFPKSTRIDTQIDRAAGAERGAIGKWQGGGFAGGEFANSAKTNSQAIKDGYTGSGPITQPATPLARAWEGHRYGRQALKPAVEMIICAQKPYEGRPVDSIVETGAGSLWIDGGRVQGAVGRNWAECVGQGKGHSTRPEHPVYTGDLGGKIMPPHSAGRWPPNFCLIHNSPHICATCDGDGCDECGDTGLAGGCRRVGTKRVKGITGGKEPHQHNAQIFSERVNRPYFNYADADGTEETAAWQCVESCAARRIGEQSGEREVSGSAKSGRPATGNDYGRNNVVFPSGIGARQGPLHNDRGTAARFFPQFGWAAEIAERLATADQVRYCSKSSRSEREAGLEGLPVQECGSLDGGDDSRIGQVRSDGAIQHTTGKPRARNIHSCIKPISLVKWLATLLLPPPEYAPRRILIPFAGVMSEAIAAMLAGWEEIVAVEMSEEYCAIGEARLKFWSQFNSYEEAMEAARNIQHSHRKQDAQVKSGQLKLTL